MALTDESPMPFGKFKGQKLIEVPARYLLWLYENNKAYGQLKEYIADNLDALRLEIGNEDY
jgi:uncharacterized protein (DUF3820 family)